MSIRKLTALFSGMAIAFLALFSLATAQDSGQTNQGGGNGLQISPTRTEVSINPGESKPYTFIVKNITSGPLDANFTINDFESDGVTGNPKIIVDDSERTPTTISNFLTGLGNFSLKPGESKEVKFNVSVPEDAVPGAYYGIVRYAAIPKSGVLNDEAERQLALTASLGHLVLVEISGDINEQIQLDSLKFGKDNKGDNSDISTSSIFFKAPDRALLAINNLGNGFSRPFGSVTINDFKNTEVQRYEVNDVTPKGIVLPKSSRTFINDLQNIKTPGRYTATASVAYGNGGEVITYKSSFWYLPVWFLLAILFVIAIIGGGGYYFYKKRYAPTKSSKRKSRR
ncbi:MAG: COG1470 family protein [Candidatus Saccharimonadales bacterium]